MAEPLVTYLRLTPEFGGTRFGPFEGSEINLGSDSSRCDITLPAELGVLPVHVKVLRQPDMSMILAPVERTATVFLWKQSARKPIQVATPTAVRALDSFALVTEAGPRFVIELGELPEALKAQRAKAKSKLSGLSKEAMLNEGKRQAWTQLLVTAPGQWVQRVVTFFKSGAAFQPRYIFLGVTIVVGYLWGGTMSCNVRKLKSNVQSYQVKYTDCQKSVSVAESMADSTKASFAELAAAIAGSALLGLDLKEDDALRAAVREQAKLVLSQSSNYDWLVLGTKDERLGTFAEWRKMLQKEEKLDPDVIKVLPFMAVEPGNNRTEWSQIEDSLGNDVCSRGQVRWTWRQAAHLGLSVQPDALVSGNLDTVQMDKAQREQLLLATIQKGGGRDLPQGSFETGVTTFGRARAACVSIVGDDDRTRFDRILKVLRDQVGTEGEGLPPAGASHDVSARIARLYAADIPDMDFREKTGFDLSKFPVGTALAAYDSKGQWVLKRTAEVFARSIVLPCEARLRAPPAQIQKLEEEVFGKLPEVVPCLVLNYSLAHESGQ
jgi:hypothetical protein